MQQYKYLDMKKLILISIIGLSVLSFTNCKEKEEEEVSHDLTPAQLYLWAENAFLDVFKQIQTIVHDTSFHLLVDDKSTVQLEIDCATIEFVEGGTNEKDSLFIIYPTNGCSGINDYVRKGTITAIFDGKYNDTLTNINILFSSYQVNGISIAPDMQITSLGVVDGNFANIINADTLLINSASGSYLFGAEYNLKWISGSDSEFPNIGDDTYEISGSSYGYYETESDEVSYKTNIIIPLTYRINCKNVIKGLSELNWGEQAINSIDYGNGSKDNLATITIDGKEYLLTID